MIEEDLVAERVAIEIYSKLMRWLGFAPVARSNLVAYPRSTCMRTKHEEALMRDSARCCRDSRGDRALIRLGAVQSG
jgi:hypothetical protein